MFLDAKIRRLGVHNLFSVARVVFDVQGGNYCSRMSRIGEKLVGLAMPLSRRMWDMESRLCSSRRAICFMLEIVKDQEQL